RRNGDALRQREGPRASRRRASLVRRGARDDERTTRASAIVAEFELDAEVALSQQGDRVLQIILRRRGDAYLVALNRCLHLLELRVLDRGRDFLRRVGIERGLELHLAAHGVAGRLLDLADVEI